MYFRNYSRDDSKFVPGTIKTQTGPLSFEVEKRDGTTARRHIDQMFKGGQCDSGNNIVPVEHDKASGVHSESVKSTSEDVVRKVPEVRKIPEVPPERRVSSRCNKGIPPEKMSL